MPGFTNNNKNNTIRDYKVIPMFYSPSPPGIPDAYTTVPSERNPHTPRWRSARWAPMPGSGSCRATLSPQSAVRRSAKGTSRRSELSKQIRTLLFKYDIYLAPSWPNSPTSGTTSPLLGMYQASCCMYRKWKNTFRATSARRSTQAGDSHSDTRLISTITGTNI